MVITFNDLREELLKYNAQLITKDQLYDWLDNNIEVKSYIPLAKKYGIVGSFVEKFNAKTRDYYDESDKKDFIYLMYDINQVFDILLSYIDVIAISMYRTVDNYDLIMSTLYDYIIDKCGDDYDRFIAICDRITGIDNLSIVRELGEIFTKIPSESEMRKIANIINEEIDHEKLNILKTVEEYNNPTMKRIVGNIQKEAAEEYLHEKRKKGDRDKEG